MKNYIRICLMYKIFKMKKTLFFIAFAFFFTACQKEKITIGENANDLFYVENKGATMPVLVEGNTKQKAIILVVHGGPGSDAMVTMNGTFMDTLEQRYAVAYWDQRNSGNTQGGANHGDLTLATMTEDLKKVILTLKSRYGQDKSIFLYAHSFGGCLSASFLTTGDNQNLVKGWVDIDGSTNYPLKDAESKKMQIAIGTVEKNAGRNVAEWTKLLDFAQANDPATSIDISDQFNANAYAAIQLISDVKPVSSIKTNDLAPSQNSVLSRTVNFTSIGVNSNLFKELDKTEFSTKLNRLTLPVLCLFGKYDFVVPPALADDVLSKVKSLNKKKVIFNNSAHDPYTTETSAFNKEIITFIEQFK
jgi:pimeloyl-ACP methyl ester carboxylesterase